MFLPMSRLEIAPEEFRAVGLRMVELAAELLAQIHSLPAYPATSGKETERLFHTAPPEAGLGAGALEALPELIRHSRPPTPRFFGYVLGSGEPVAAAADLLASALNQNVTAWRSSPAAVAVERTVVEWLAQGVGCGGMTGSLTGGGSAANLMGLAMARESKLPANQHGAQPGVVYASDEVHMSIPKAVALLGLGRENLRLIPTDENFRMRAGELERAVEQDQRAGKRAIAIVASAGTVNTGSIDPLPEIAAMACGCTWMGRMGRWPRWRRHKSLPASSRRIRFRSILTSGYTSPWTAAACCSAIRRRRAPLSHLPANTPEP